MPDEKGGRHEKKKMALREKYAWLSLLVTPNGEGDSTARDVRRGRTFCSQTPEAVQPFQQRPDYNYKHPTGKQQEGGEGTRAGGRGGEGRRTRAGEREGGRREGGRGERGGGRKRAKREGGRGEGGMGAGAGRGGWGTTRRSDATINASIPPTSIPAHCLLATLYPVLDRVNPRLGSARL